MSIYGQSDREILRDLGARLRECRLRQNLSQQALAQRSGVHRSTLSELERGASATLLTLIQLLRALGELDAVESFLPNPGPSPLELARRQGHRRQRASRRSRKPKDQ